MTADDLRSKLWRLQNLYSIKDAATGKVVKFRPREEQMTIFKALAAGVRKIIILKARRLGMSTAIDVYAADEVTFNAGVQISIIDRKGDDATKKLNGICKVAFNSLPASLKEKAVQVRDNDGSWVIRSRSEDTDSAIYAGLNARGGTNQLLHVSEWGVIQADDPPRSEEILTGALPSAEHGVVVVETTWKGGRAGHLWKLVKEAMETPEDQRTLDDWHLYFFPWWTDPTYKLHGVDVRNIPQDVAKYLEEKEEELSIVLSDAQKCWYAKKRADLGAFVYREFPTSIDECFKSPMDGAIYAQELDKLRSEGGIVRYKVDESALVHTFWDLGAPSNMVVWYIQIVGREFRVIDVDYSTEERPLNFTPVKRAAHMLAKGYNYGFHNLPHDAMQKDKGGRTLLNEMTEAGLQNCRVVPRTKDIWIGINRLRQLMPAMVFRLPHCEAALDALMNYHTRTEGNSIDQPVHDWSSHAADGLRTFAEAEMAGMVSAHGPRPGRVRAVFSHDDRMRYRREPRVRARNL